MIRRISSAGLVLVVILAAASVPAAVAQTQSETVGYLDNLDSYYERQDLENLKLARNAIRSELDTTVALRFQSYYYSTEIEYLLALEDLKLKPRDPERLSQLKTLLLQLYSRYLDAYYKVEPADIKNSNIPGNTAFLIKDIMMAAEFVPNANSFIPIVDNVIRRADRDDMYNRDNSFIASVKDMIQLEYPNLFGTANMVKAVWLNDKFLQADEDSEEKEQLRQLVSHHASIAADTVSSGYGRSISYFLLAESNANLNNDMAWDYFKKCIDVFVGERVTATGFYARNYNQEVYLATAVAFIPAYAEYLFENGRYAEIVEAAQYLTELELLDKGKSENVSKEAIYWGEKSIRALQDAGRHESADEIFKGLQLFYKELEKATDEYGVTPEG
jgi:hypothetical protein